MSVRPRGSLSSLIPVLLVPDVNKAVDFYVNALGFIEDIESPVRGCRAVFRDGVEIHLAQSDITEVRSNNASRNGAPKVADIDVFADDVQVFYEELRERGASVIGEPKEDDGLRCLWVQDRYGYWLRFMQPASSWSPAR